jgi:hypothetical protein
LLGASTSADVKQLQILRRELEAIAATLARPIGQAHGKQSLRPLGVQRRGALQSASLPSNPQTRFDNATQSGPDRSN